MTSRTAPAERARQPSLARVAWAPAATVMAVLFATASRYGFHGDELYFRALPLAWWYDDQPPLTVWLSRAAADVNDAVWVQRLPTVLAAGAGAFVATAFPRVLGHGVRVQRVAAWAHAFTVYPLLMGHVFLTASLDLLAWQLLALCVVAALVGRPWALAWAGVVAGLACWNKLLVLVYVAALAVALCAGARRMLRTRQAVVGALALIVIGGAQVAAQLVHGLPMFEVSRSFVAANGSTNRWLIVPLLVVFLGPPFVTVWWHGLAWTPPIAPGTTPSAARSRPVLGIAAALVLVWSLAVPAQPYYAVPAFLPALAVGWGLVAERRTDLWRRARLVVAANAAVAMVLCLPLVPASSRAFEVVSSLNPVMRDEVGWPDLVRQMAQARDGDDVAVVTDSSALAGAAARYGRADGLPRRLVASGQNAMWSLGPPDATHAVLLTGRYVDLRGLFERCTDAGRLRPRGSDPFELGGTPMVRCIELRTSWAQAWPQFEHLGR